MIHLDKKTHLKDSEEYEAYTENEAKLTDEEKKMLGIKVCACKCKKGK
ncbi:MAG: hypothetical protein ACRDDY_19010 [Clostridium sp.]